MKFENYSGIILCQFLAKHVQTLLSWKWSPKRENVTLRFSPIFAFRTTSCQLVKFTEFSASRHRAGELYIYIYIYIAHIPIQRFVRLSCLSTPNNLSSIMHYYLYPNSHALNKFSNSIFSITKRHMKKLYSMSSVYFFTLRWPLVDSTTITGTPCVPKRKGREKTVQGEEKHDRTLWRREKVH